MKKIRILNTEISNVTLPQALDIICAMVIKRTVGYVVTPNVHHLILLQSDKEFQGIYKKAALVLADGMPLLWAAKFLGTPLIEKISGSDLTPALCDCCSRNGFKVFLLGGRLGAAVKAGEKLQKQYPGLQIVGTYCPPFGFEFNNHENAIITKIIKDSQPDILFVGLGAPKQERWIHKYYLDLRVPVNIGVGVTFEFIAGMVKRAPLWMQRCGLEWFWRLIMEPKRLWKRYLVEDIKFFMLILQSKFKA